MAMCICLGNNFALNILLLFFFLLEARANNMHAYNQPYYFLHKVLNHVMGEIDSKQKVDFDKESLEQRVERTLEILRIWQYKPKNEDLYVTSIIFKQLGCYH